MIRATVRLFAILQTRELKICGLYIRSYGYKDNDITVDVKKDWFENLINKLKTMKAQMMPGMEHYNTVEYLLGRLNFIAYEIDWDLDNVKMYVGYCD